MLWKKNKHRLGVVGSRQQMLAGGLWREGTISSCPLDLGLARNALGLNCTTYLSFPFSQVGSASSLTVKNPGPSTI